MSTRSDGESPRTKARLLPSSDHYVGTRTVTAVYRRRDLQLGTAITSTPAADELRRAENLLVSINCNLQGFGKSDWTAQQSFRKSHLRTTHQMNVLSPTVVQDARRS